MSTVSRSRAVPQLSLAQANPRWLALALFFLTILLRIPFVSQTLNHWDSVNHALALTTFDVYAHRPQPPGYILYIGFARLVNLILPDPQTALVTVSIVASALAVAFLFLLVNQMASRGVGLAAALLLMTSPPFWFDSEVALPYVVEGSASAAVGLLCYKLAVGEKKYVLLTAVVLAIAGGLRQQLFLFLAPLAVFAYWSYGWRVWVKAGLLFVGVSLLSLVPLFWNVGGVLEYFRLLQAFSRAYTTETSVFAGGGIGAFVRNSARVGVYTVYALNLAIVPMALGLVQVIRQSSLRALWGDVRTRFFVFWISPSVLFYLLYHMGSPGLIYVFLPALYAIAALAIFALLEAQTTLRALAVGALVAANVLIFVGLPADLYTGRALRVLNYSAMVEHDRSLMARTSAIRENFDPATTLVLGRDWRFAEYYLPSFRVVFMPYEPGTQLIVSQNQKEAYMWAQGLDTSNVETLVWFDEVLPPEYGEIFTGCMLINDERCLPVRELEGTGKVRIVTNRIEVIDE